MEPEQNNLRETGNHDDDEDISLSFGEEEFNRIYTNELKKQQLQAKENEE